MHTAAVIDHVRLAGLIRRKQAEAVQLAAAAAGTPPPAGQAGAELGPLWRRVYPTPPDVRFDVGPYCPLSDHVLVLDRAGWHCPAGTCLAVWDFWGRHGRWEVAAE